MGVRRKKQISDLVRGRKEGEEQIVVFNLGGEDYGIEINQVREIIRKREITPVPRQPAYVEGVINVRGTIIPVVNLKKRFGLQGDPSIQPHTIIVESGEGLVGILVDSVSEVIRVPQDRIHPPPTVSMSVDSQYLRGICRVGDRLLIYLDVKRVVSDMPALNSGSQDLRVQESVMATG
jgi:purine-binding chemotaxis protein CheW